MRPEDYDFPMSDTFRAWSYDYCGVSDPANTEVAELRQQVEELQSLITTPSKLPKKYQEEIDQLKGELAYTRNKLAYKSKRRYERYD